VHALRQAGEEVTHLREEGLHTLPDDSILDKAKQEQSVILTFDLDFGDLLAAGGHTILRISLAAASAASPWLEHPSRFGRDVRYAGRTLRWWVSRSLPSLVLQFGLYGVKRCCRDHACHVTMRR